MFYHSEPQPREYQVIAFLRSGQYELVFRGPVQAATLAQALRQAANIFADANNLSLVATRDDPPRFYANGEELLVDLL